MKKIAIVLGVLAALGIITSGAASAGRQRTGPSVPRVNRDGRVLH